MSRKQKKARDGGAPLPENVLTDKRMCVCLCIPDEPEYRQAFRGQLAELGKWFFWELGGGEDRRATQAAELWRRLLYEELQMPCCCGNSQGVQERFDADGNLEISTDGGATWTPATPAQDPRQSGSYAPVPPGSDTADGKCKNANSFISYMKQEQAARYAQMTANAGAAAIAGAIIAFLVAVGVIATGGALAVLGAGLGALLTSFDASSWNSAFTDEFWADFLCLVYCRLDDDGHISEAASKEIRDGIIDMQPNKAGDWAHRMVYMMGEVGCTNAARAGLEGALDCSGCEPCFPSCGDKWAVQYGTLVGFFDGYLRVTSQVVGSTSLLSIITDNKDNCCKLIDVRVLTEGIVPIKSHILCGFEVVEGNINPGWGLEGCYNYLTSQLSIGDSREYTVEFLFADCD